MINSQFKQLINKYISSNYYIHDNEIYEMDSRRLILPLNMEEHITKVFGMSEDLNYLVVYMWCFLNGKKKIAEYWERYDPSSTNPIIQEILTDMGFGDYEDVPINVQPVTTIRIHHI